MTEAFADRPGRSFIDRSMNCPKVLLHVSLSLSLSTQSHTLLLEVTPARNQASHNVIDQIWYSLNLFEFLCMAPAKDGSAWFEMLWRLWEESHRSTSQASIERWKLLSHHITPILETILLPSGSQSWQSDKKPPCAYDFRVDLLVPISAFFSGDFQLPMWVPLLKGVPWENDNGPGFHPPVIKHGKGKTTYKLEVFNQTNHSSDIWVCKSNRGVSISMFDHQRVTFCTAWAHEKTLPAIVGTGSTTYE